jgi:type VI secretion system secreted protein Hcp
VSCQIYLKLEGIAGDCTDGSHKDWMVLESFNQNVNGPRDRGGCAAMTDLAVTKLSDRATPLLARATAEGRHFKEAVLELCVPDGAKPKFLEIRLTNVRVTSYGIAGSLQSDTRTPYETLMLGFDKVEWLYFPNAFVPGHEKEVSVCRTGWSTDGKAAAV